MSRTVRVPFIRTLALEEDVANFVIATQITDDTQIGAITVLVDDLKSGGIWQKFKAIYPMIGGSSYAHKFNLVDPRDADDAFRLRFVGNPNHSGTGVKWDGSTQYADTYFAPSLHLTPGAGSHMSYYSRDANIAGGDPLDMGAHNSGAQSMILIGFHGAGGFVVRHFADYAVHPSSRLGKGHYLSTNTNTSQTSPAYENGVRVGATPAGGQYPTVSIYLGGMNFSGSLYGPVPRECAFATIGDHLTDNEALALYTAIQRFQTTLNRQV